MIRHHCVLALSLSALPGALAAQEQVFQGLATRAEVLPVDALSRTLSDGRIVTFDGEFLDLWEADGDLITNIGTFPNPGVPGVFEVAPDESFVLVGERNPGRIYRAELDGSDVEFIDTLLLNRDAAFESNDDVLVSAQTGTAGDGFELWRLDLDSGKAVLLASLPGAAGRIALEADGDVLCMPATPGEVGTAELVRFTADELVPNEEPILAATGGMLAVEVESHPPTGDWVEESSEAGFSGDSYYRWAGPNLFGSPGSGVMSWTFEIFEAGEYLFRLHNLHNDPDVTMENDCWVRMDDDHWIKVFSGHDFPTWNWETVFDPETGPSVGAKYQLEEGTHTIRISGRSNNFRIDRWHLFLTGTPAALNFDVPLSVEAAPLYDFDASLVADGFDGVSGLEVAPVHGTILVAETSSLSGASRVHAIGPAFPSSPVVLETAPDTMLEHLDFRPEPGAFFFPFQPEESGALVYHVRNTGNDVLERRSLVAQRPGLVPVGDGTSGFGPMTLELSGAWPDGFAVFVASPANLLAGTETAYTFAGFPFVHTAMNPEATVVLPVPLPVDGDGDYPLGFFNTLGTPGLVASQMIVLTEFLDVVGSSETTVF